MKQEIIFDLMKNFETYSLSKIHQTSGWYENNSDIRWQANCVNSFQDENITEYYMNDEYARATRWNLWNNLVDIFPKYNIQSNLDLGCANNHFSFLCNKKNIFSIGIDPRQNCVKESDSLFQKEFGNSYGYVGNFQTFNEFFGNTNEILFDCITILNFLHGNDHISSEIENLFKVLPKISKYAIITEPKWNELRIPKYTDHYEVLEIINNTIVDHTLYQLQKNK